MIDKKISGGGGGAGTSDLIIDASPSERPAILHRNRPHLETDAPRVPRRGVSKPGVTRSRSQKRKRA